MQGNVSYEGSSTRLDAAPPCLSDSCGQQKQVSISLHVPEWPCLNPMRCQPSRQPRGIRSWQSRR